MQALKLGHPDYTVHNIKLEPKLKNSFFSFGAMKADSAADQM